MDPQKEIEALRKENADRRTRHQPFAEAFEGWDETQTNYMLGVIQQLGDPQRRESGYRELFTLAEAGLKAYDGGEPDPPPDPEPEGDPDMTLPAGEDFDKAVAEATEKRLAEERKRMEEEYQRKEVNAQIDAEARALGVEPGTSAFAQLLHHATRIEGADQMPIKESLKLAHNKMLDEMGQLFEAAGFTKPDAETGGGEGEPATSHQDATPSPEPDGDRSPIFAPTAGAGGAGAPGSDAPGEDGKISSMEDARVGFEKFLDNQQAPAS